MFNSALKMMAAPGLTVHGQMAQGVLGSKAIDLNKLASDPKVQKKLKSRRKARVRGMAPKVVG